MDLAATMAFDGQGAAGERPSNLPMQYYFVRVRTCGTL